MNPNEIRKTLNKRVSLKEILSNPLFYYLNIYGLYPQNFTTNNKDAVEIIREFNNLIQRTQSQITVAEKSNDEIYDDLEKGYINILLKNENKINVEKYIASAGIFSAQLIEDTDASKLRNYVHLSYLNGESVSYGKDGNKNFKFYTALDVEDSRIGKCFYEAAAIAHAMLSARYQKKPLIFSGKIKYHDSAQYEDYKFSTKKLDEIFKTPNIIKIPSFMVSDFIKEGILQKDKVMYALKKKAKEKKLEEYKDSYLLYLLAEGAIEPSDLFRHFAITPAQLIKRDVTWDSRFLAYINGKVSVKDLENAKLDDFTNFEIQPSTLRLYKGKINQIAEILTHNVLDSQSSESYLEQLQEQKVITEEDRAYLKKIMIDFKTEQLLNNADNESFFNQTSKLHGEISIPTFKQGIAIDPVLRAEYLRSIGAIKSVKIKGVNEETSKENRENGLDGYELLVLPDKEVAILEKFYECTRDEKGNVKYRLNKSGNKIPATDNATYILPIELARDLVESKNKRQLLDNPLVSRSFHTANWVGITERKIMQVNREVEFDENNTKKYRDLIEKNYKRNHEVR